MSDEPKKCQKCGGKGYTKTPVGADGLPGTFKCDVCKGWGVVGPWTEQTKPAKPKRVKVESLPLAEGGGVGETASGAKGRR